MKLINPAAVPPANPSYSQASVSGAIVHLAGQIGIDTEGRLVSPEVGAQTRRIFQNVQHILAAAGSSLDRVLKVTVFIVDLGQWGAMNEVYLAFFAGHAPPKTTVQVSGLAMGAAVEIEFVAETSQAEASTTGTAATGS